MKRANKYILTLRQAIKAGIFVLSFSNFIFIWLQQKIQMTTTLSFCAHCPWYETWRYTNEPSILLVSAFLLLVSRWWSYLLAGVLSGYVLGVGILSLWISDLSLRERWVAIQKYEVNVFLALEVQWILAVIIFGFVIFYCVHGSLRPKQS